MVFRAFDPKIDRVVAIKTISLAGQDPEVEYQYRQRFLQEARAAGRLSHPGIVTIYDAAEDADTHESYIVMEYVAGEPLSRIMSGASHKLPLHAALQLTQEIAEALDYAHSQGVVHRDIKPANILITADGHAKIADFGVARLNQELMTQPGQIVGSPAYMAPEQMSGGEADARSDLFSLGVILYSMITGFRPFQGNSARTVCFKVMNVEPVPVTTFEHDIPPQLNDLIARAIAKDPKDRYQSGAEMARDIRTLRGADSSLSTDTAFFARVVQANPGSAFSSAAQRRTYRQLNSPKAFWIATVATVLIAAGVAGWKVWNSPAQLSSPQLKPATPQLPADFEQLSKRPINAKELPARKPTSAKSSAQNAAAVPDPTDGRLQVEIEHHFQAARADIWVDDNLVFEQNLRGASNRHPIFRTVEMNQISNLHMKAGKHLVQVRVVSYPSEYDQVEMIEIELEPGAKKVLLVNCDNRKKMEVTLQ